jgi:hypothetical protein
MNPLATQIVTFVVSMGAGSVVGNAIKASTPQTAKLITKIGIGIGGVTLSSLAGSMAAKQTIESINTTIADIKGIYIALRKKEDI